MEKIITCFSRREVERGINFRGRYALISIRDPGSPSVRVPKQSGQVEVLELQFHDAEPTSSMTLPSGIEIITEEQAKTVAEFVRRLHAAVDGFAVHCEQGMSRSPAVAVAIARHLKQSDETFWQEHQPNQYVLELVEESFTL
jgi:predicted protein tyrosine phosphatase